MGIDWCQHSSGTYTSDAWRYGYRSGLCRVHDRRSKARYDRSEIRKLVNLPRYHFNSLPTVFSYGEAMSESREGQQAADFLHVDGQVVGLFKPQRRQEIVNKKSPDSRRESSRLQMLK